MMPYITIAALGITIPSYGLMVLIGVLVSLLYIWRAEKKSPLLDADIELTTIYAVIGTVVGAKVLYILTILPDFLEEMREVGLTSPEFYMKYLSGGFVFYGGFLGAFAGAYLYARFARISFDEVCTVLVPVVPLFHVFGRIGCFLEGCCYGMESERFGIAFTYSQVAPNGVPLLPVQLIESAAELLIFLILQVMLRKGHKGVSLLWTWAILYAITRFVLEFFRGDEYRGVIGGISLSQVISLALLLFVFAWICRSRQNTAADSQKTTGISQG